MAGPARRVSTGAAVARRWTPSPGRRRGSSRGVRALPSSPLPWPVLPSARARAVCTALTTLSAAAPAARSDGSSSAFSGTRWVADARLLRCTTCDNSSAKDSPGPALTGDTSLPAGTTGCPGASARAGSAWPGSAARQPRSRAGGAGPRPATQPEVTAWSAAVSAAFSSGSAAPPSRAARASPPACCTTWASSCASSRSPPGVCGRNAPAPNTMSRPAVRARAPSPEATRSDAGPVCTRTAEKSAANAPSIAARVPAGKAAPPPAVAVCRSRCIPAS